MNDKSQPLQQATQSIPQPIPTGHPSGGACIPFAVANLRNTPQPYDVQSAGNFPAFSFGAAARYLDFWAECVDVRISPPAADFFDFLDAHRKDINLRGIVDAYLCFAAHSCDRTKSPTQPHCTFILVGAADYIAIDALNGIARFEYDVYPHYVERVADFVHWSNLLRIFIEIDNCTPLLDQPRIYTKDELAHLLSLPLYSFDTF